MATNEIYDHGDSLELPVPATYTSGDPVVVGKMPGVLQTDRDSDGNAIVKMRGVFDLSVEGTDAVGNTAIAVGDAVFWTLADDPLLSADESGELFGHALEVVLTSATSTIKVRVARTGDARAPGEVPLLSIGLAELAADAVDGTKIGDDSIDSEHYVAASIDNEHLADDAVDSDEIADGAVDPVHLAGGFSKVTLADGTAAAADVTIAGMVVGDELVSVLSYTTKASIASVDERTSEYVVGAGVLTKAGGTDESAPNQLVVTWNDLT